MSIKTHIEYICKCMHSNFAINFCAKRERDSCFYVDDEDEKSSGKKSLIYK